MKLIALIDANVLYDAFLRSLLLRIHLKGGFQIKWTDEIQEEWVRNLIQNRQDLDSLKIRRIRELMESSAPDARVENYQHRIGGLSLPDPNDRHVLAAAIECNADCIVTFNLPDFPAVSVGAISVMHPDAFLMNVYSAYPDEVLSGIIEHRSTLKNPPYTSIEYADKLLKLGLVRLSAAVKDLI